MPRRPGPHGRVAGRRAVTTSRYATRPRRESKEPRRRTGRPAQEGNAGCCCVSTSLQAVHPAGAGTAHDGFSGDGLIENVFANVFIEPPVHLLTDDFLKCTAARVHPVAWTTAEAVRRFAYRQISSTAMHRWWYRELEEAGIAATGETSGERMHKAATPPVSASWTRRAI